MIANGNLIIVDGGVTRVKTNYNIGKDNIEGYPITEAFLRTNGWKCEGYYWGLGGTFKGAKMERYHEQWYLKVENAEVRFEGWIKFVHELQNILDVCGFSKRWKLCE